MNDIITKRCGKCREYKPLECFSKDKSRGDGLLTFCKTCASGRSKAYYSSNKNSRLEKGREYRSKNRDHVIEVKAKWRDKNREKVREYVRRWARNHKEKMLEIARNWVNNNRQRSRENQRRWANEHKDRRMLTVEKRRAQKAASGGLITKKEWQEVKDKYGNKCLCCGAGDVVLTMDHVVPLSAGGSHSKDNIQPLCGICNSRKHTKIIDYRPF